MPTPPTPTRGIPGPHTALQLLTHPNLAVAGNVIGCCPVAVGSCVINCSKLVRQMQKDGKHQKPADKLDPRHTTPVAQDHKHGIRLATDTMAALDTDETCCLVGHRQAEAPSLASPCQLEETEPMEEPAPHSYDGKDEADQHQHKGAPHPGGNPAWGMTQSETSDANTSIDAAIKEWEVQQQETDEKMEETDEEEGEKGLEEWRKLENLKDQIKRIECEEG